MNATDPRVAPVRWRPLTLPTTAQMLASRTLLALSLAASVWYFAWVLQPGRIGNPVMYGILIMAEIFNLVQALGFWWTCAKRKVVPVLPPDPCGDVDVDILIPVYNEPCDVIEPVIRAAMRLTGARPHVTVLDDGNSAEVRALAKRCGAKYLRRSSNRGAKAGNLNDALARTFSPLIAVLDCDHVPGERFLEATVGFFADSRVAFVQSPQFYANAEQNRTANAAWSQQALFFGAIATGKASHDAMFCCGTNVLFRRHALEAVGGFPEDSVTEDFTLSVSLHSLGWRSVYVPEVLAQGLGPEDMTSYISQQLRWSRGCITAIPVVLRSRLSMRLRLQYLLSASYFLYGWAIIAYISIPVARILFGVQPFAPASNGAFLWHFAPYFTLAMATVARTGSGSYTFAAFALAAVNFWIGVVSTVRAVLRRPARFVVTPKQGTGNWQPRFVAPALTVTGLLTGVSAWGLLHNPSPGVVNAVAVALLHSVIMLRGAAAALDLTALRSKRAQHRQRPQVPEAALPALAASPGEQLQPHALTRHVREEIHDNDGSGESLWITPGSLETVGSGKDGRYGSGEEVPGGVEGARGGDGA